MLWWNRKDPRVEPWGTQELINANQETVVFSAHTALMFYLLIDFFNLLFLFTHLNCKAKLSIKKIIIVFVVSCTILCYDLKSFVP